MDVQVICLCRIYFFEAILFSSPRMFNSRDPHQEDWGGKRGRRHYSNPYYSKLLSFFLLHLSVEKTEPFGKYVSNIIPPTSTTNNNHNNTKTCIPRTRE